MKYAFFLVVFVFLFSMIGLALLRGWQILPVKMNIRAIYVGLIVASQTLMITSLFFENMMPSNLSKSVSFIGFTFLLIVVYLLFSFLLVDIVRVANYFLHFAPAGMQTFRLWAFTGSLIIIIPVLFIGSYQFNHPKRVELNIQLENSPRQNKELKIVAASDIHLGNSIDIHRLKIFVDLINQEHPDIVLLLGDITDRSASPLSEQNMKTVLQTIRAPHGIYAIRGNHEYYSGKPQEISGYLSASGINVLEDATYLVDSSIYIIGRDDRSNFNRKSLNELVQGLDNNLPKILLDHQPYHLEEAEQNNMDLQLSGHTHNGQIFPGNLLVKKMYELSHGYLKKGKTHYYVSSGLGIWGPQYRIGTQSELVVINLNY